MNIIEKEIEGYEQVKICKDEESGLKAVIAIHSTTLGPAVGGTRFWWYDDKTDFFNDALKLSKAMTYKASMAGLWFGGGKGVVRVMPKMKTKTLLQTYGKFIDTFNGRFITGEDVGCTMADVRILKEVTPYITGLKESPAPSTARGVINGMKACAEEVFGEANLDGLDIAVQGIGSVGYSLVELLLQEKVRRIVIADINRVRLSDISHDKIYKESVENICFVPCDIFAPCALGGILNSETIPKLNCNIVAGAANNQLMDEEAGKSLKEKGILYAPDYVINAGGLIRIAFEWLDRTDFEDKVNGIGDTIRRIISEAKERDCTTDYIADILAQERILREDRSHWK